MEFYGHARDGFGDLVHNRGRTDDHILRDHIGTIGPADEALL